MGQLTRPQEDIQAAAVKPDHPHPTTIRLRRILPLGFLLLTLTCQSRDLEPRRWSHLPTGINFAAGGYAYTEGDISFNPVLRIENTEFDLHTFALKYIRTFELFGKSARFDLAQAYQSGRWEGLLDGAPASTERNGLSDTTLRFAVNLLGAPPLKGREFAAYRAGTDCETILGVGLALQLPTGHYKEDKLINLGSNRFTFRPQIGVIHNRGKWSMELNGSAWIYTDNDEFYAGNRLEQDPLYTVQGHLIYTFRPGLWLGAGVGYGFAGESTVNGNPSYDRKGNFVWAISLGIPVNPRFGLKLAYIGTRTTKRTGADTHTIALACSVLW